MNPINKDITEITRCGVQYRTDAFAPMGLKACHGSYLRGEHISGDIYFLMGRKN